MHASQYFTDYAYEPVRRIAAASTTGHGTNIIAGVAVGMESTAIAALVTGFSILGGFVYQLRSGHDAASALGQLRNVHRLHRRRR